MTVSLADNSLFYVIGMELIKQLPHDTSRSTRALSAVVDMLDIRRTLAGKGDPNRYREWADFAGYVQEFGIDGIGNDEIFDLLARAEIAQSAERKS